MPVAVWRRPAATSADIRPNARQPRSWINAEHDGAVSGSARQRRADRFYGMRTRFPESRLRQYRKDFAPALRPIAGLDHAVLVDRDPPRPVSITRREDAGRRRLSFGNALADRGVPSTCGPFRCGFRNRRRHQEGGERKRSHEHSETRMFNAHANLPLQMLWTLANPGPRFAP